MSGDSLELSAVRKRFNDAADTLDVVRERLNAVALTQETAVASAGTLEHASARLDSIATELGSLTAEMASAVRSTEQSLALADRFLQQTDLSELHEVLGQIRTASDQNSQQTAARLDQVTTTQNELVEFVTWLQTHIGEMEQAEERALTAETRANTAETELLALKQAIPPRVRGRLGISDS